MKSGLPSAAPAMRARSSASTSAARCPTRASDSSCESGSSTIVGALTRALVQQLRPRETEEQQRRVTRERCDALDQIEERRLGPVDVVEDYDERPPPRERLEQAARGPCDLVRAAGGGRLEPFRDCGRIRLAGQRGFDAGARRISEAALHELRERPECDPLAVRQAAASDDVGAETADELGGKPRLADPGRPGERNECRPARTHDALERLRELCELVGAADERSVAAPRHGRAAQEPRR